MSPLYVFTASAVPVALLGLGISRLGYWTIRPGSRLFTGIILAIGAGQAMRIPILSDDHVDPLLQQITGVYNLTDASAVCLGVFAGMSIIAAIARVTESRFYHPRVHAVVTAVVVTLTAAGFLSSPAADTPTRFVSKDFPPTGPLLLYWGLYLGTLLLAMALVLNMMIRLIRLPGLRAGPLGPALTTLIAASFTGFLYATVKFAYLLMQAAGWRNGLTDHAQSITLLLVVTPMVLVGGTVVAYLAKVLPARIRRYQAIRQSSSVYEEVLSGLHRILPRDAATYSTRRSAWIGSRTSTATHRMMVVLADAAVQSGEQHATSRN